MKTHNTERATINESSAIDELPDNIASSEPEVDMKQLSEQFNALAENADPSLLGNSLLKQVQEANQKENSTLKKVQAQAKMLQDYENKQEEQRNSELETNADAEPYKQAEEFDIVDDNPLAENIGTAMTVSDIIAEAKNYDEETAGTKPTAKESKATKKKTTTLKKKK